MINIYFNSKVKKMGATWDGSTWVPPEISKDIFEKIQEKYFGNPINVELTITDDNRDLSSWLGFSHAISISGYVIATSKGRDTGARITDGVAIIEGTVDSGGSMKNYRCIISGDKIRVRMRISANMLEEIKSKENVNLIVLEERKEKISEIPGKGYKMKNYLAFYGDIFYPNGGMSDFIGDYDTKNEAIKAIELKNKKTNNDLNWEFTWCSVWSCQDRKEVFTESSFQNKQN